MTEQNLMGWFMIAAAIYFGGCVLLTEGVSLSADTPEKKRKASRFLKGLGGFFVLGAIIIALLTFAASC